MWYGQILRRAKTATLDLLWRLDRDLVLDILGFQNNTVRQDEVFRHLLALVRSHRVTTQSVREMYNIHRLVEFVSGIPGDLAEVGVYRGESACVICRAKGNRPLYLFDTFEGMPEVKHAVDLHRRGDFHDTTLQSVQTRLREFSGVRYCQGVFPESAAALSQEELRFAFVPLDVALYGSTLSALRYFYPLISPGGVILSHDYRSISCPGVKKAFDEFFRDKPERVIELWDTQCLVVKR